MRGLVALTAAALAAAGLLPESAAAWGARTHEIINRRAAEAVPGPAADAWRPLAGALGANASAADDRKRTDPDEAPRHYLDADALAPPPFEGIPRTLDGFRRKFGPSGARSWGAAPWAIDECYRMLVLSLRREDWSSAGAWAADLGHYVADTHQPLHCTHNYDGQRTGHDGIHLRFEITMMDRHFREDELPLGGHGPERPDRPIEACFAWMAEAHDGLETLLAAEAAARAVDPSFGDAYYASLWAGSGDVARQQVQAAIVDLAALYATAWEEAGRPAGPEGVPPFQALPVAALEAPPGRSSRPSLRALGVAALTLASALLVGSR